MLFLASYKVYFLALKELARTILKNTLNLINKASSLSKNLQLSKFINYFFKKVIINLSNKASFLSKNL